MSDTINIGAFGGILIDGIADKIEAGHAEAFFVYSVVEKRIFLIVGVGCDIGDTKDGVVGVDGFSMAEGKRVVAWSNNDLFAIGEIVV